MANGYYGQPAPNMPGSNAGQIAGQSGGWYAPQPGYSYNTPQPQQTRQQDAGMVWVENEEEASGWPIAPGVALPLWDKHKPYIYLKSADQFGMTTYKRIKYTVEGEQTNSPIASSPAQPDMTGYVKSTDFDNLAAEVRELKNRLYDATPINFPDDGGKKK